MSTGPTGPEIVPGPKVFITYRREETGAHAGRLYDAMAARFGEDNVFMDVDMAPGVDFVERITEAVAACHVLIVVMGPTWATVQDEQGSARLTDPEDFVRLEVETALRRPEVTPIPVLVAGARMPKREDLPPEVRAITRRNALELGDQRWRDDVGRLMSAIDELLAESAVAPSPSAREHSVTAGRPPAGDAAQTAGRAAPPSTIAATTAVDREPEAPSRAAGRLRRWALLGAAAIAAIVVAVVLATRGGDSASQTTHYTKAELPKLVLPATDEPGNLSFEKSDSGPYVKGLTGINPVTLDLFTEAKGQGYRNAFLEQEKGQKPYEYAESTSAVFPDKSAAQEVLDSLEAGYQGPKNEDLPAVGLGDDRFAVLTINKQSRPEHLYVWRTGNLLQFFYLIWNRLNANEDTARGWADKIAALAHR
jgi:hypothetical protein